MKKVIIVVMSILIMISCSEQKKSEPIQPTGDSSSTYLSVHGKDMNEIVDLYKSARGAFSRGDMPMVAHIYGNLSDIANDSSKDIFIRRHACKVLQSFKNYMRDDQVSAYVWSIDTRIRYLASLSDEDYFLVMKEEANTAKKLAK